MLRSNGRLLGLVLVTAFSFGACDCGSEAGLKVVKDGTIEILSPVEGATVSTNLTFTARASSSEGITGLTLLAGTVEVASCPPEADPASVKCVKVVDVAGVVNEVQNNALLLTARATLASGDELTKSITVTLAPLTVEFVRPSAGQSGSVAQVSGKSDVELAVESLTDVESVVVLYDDNETPIAQWRGASKYKQSIAWGRVMGTGEHVLKAAARDVNGATARKELRIQVMCAEDSDCASGNRCCSTSGTCNPVVASGADCDCENPCPSDQGCFPGTCGQLPRKCRPGCYPGGNSPGDYADKCRNEVLGGQSVPAYCSQLPAAEANSQNQGGACAPGSACDVMLQNCPDAPLDRNNPAGPNNPIVKYTCAPAGPNSSGRDIATCYPAGNLPDGTTNCAGSSQVCTDVSNACAKGMLCVTPIDGTGAATDASSCRKQCATSMGGSVYDCLYGGSSGCPGGQYCAGLVGAGLEPYMTGACMACPI